MNQQAKRWSRRGALGLVLGVGGIAAVLRPAAQPRASVARQATPVASPAGVGLPADVFLVLGDSIAAGIGASDPMRRGLAAILRGYLERVADAPVELVNLAIPGETTATFAEGGQLAEALRLIEEARGAGLRVSPILVSLGANDLLAAGDDRDALDSAIETVAGTLASALASLRAAAGDGADLFVLTYYDPSSSDPDRRGSTAWWVGRLNVAIARAAGEVGGRAVDLASLVRGREEELTWYPSDVHPTNAGHAAIARAVWIATGYDTVPPAVALVRPTDGPLPRPRPTIVATAEDRVGVEEVVALLDGEPLGELAFHSAAGAYLLLWDAGALPGGDHRLEVRASDTAGNVGSAAATVRRPLDPATPPGLVPAGTPVVAPGN